MLLPASLPATRSLWGAWLFFAFIGIAWAGAVPVEVEPVTAPHGLVVAAHPEAAAIGIAVLQAGGNAVDAAVAVSLAVGVAEPYGSGLGGKLLLLYHDAKSGRTRAVEAMDQASWSLEPEACARRPAEERRSGWSSVCVPGLAAGLEAAHRRWGVRPWADNIRPAVALARRGFTVLPKARALFEEKEEVLRRGDPEIARLYLPGGRLPEAGSHLPNEDLANTMELLAADGADAFYRGPVAAAIVAAAQKGGGILTREDFARYEARVVEPAGVSWLGLEIMSGPPPSSGSALMLPILKALEPESWSGPLRSAENLDRLGRVWQQAQPRASRSIADVPEARSNLARLLSDASIAEIRREAGLLAAHARPAAASDVTMQSKVERVDPNALWDFRLQKSALGATRSAFQHTQSLRRNMVRLHGSGSDRPSPTLTDWLALFGDAFEPELEDAHASTTHFIVVDQAGNIVCATQSQSLHFGAGVVAPGTGVVLNNTMNNFAVSNPRSVNYLAPGKRPRSTITPTIVLRDGKPVLALGIPGAQRIPTAVLQVLLDHFVFHRPLAEAIGDTRLHLLNPMRPDDPNNVFEVEESLPADVEAGLVKLGWKVVRREPAGAGRHFGGLNAVELRPDGSRTGYADPRRTNAAIGH